MYVVAKSREFNDSEAQGNATSEKEVKKVERNQASVCVNGS